MLCVQRTGWGKSAVYFLATALLRERGAGPALIVSPLLALMRNQIAAAERLGIRAHTINSTNRDAWEEVRALLADDAVDLLLISPERLNNPQFRDAMLPLFAERVGLLVVDEAHCISDWGHDFRPDYRRLAEMLERLPDGVAVLGTTATANDRVVADVEEQLRAGVGDAPLRTYRGPLGRSSLRLEVVELPAQADRLAWLATWLPRLEGSGIVYTLTKRDADLVAGLAERPRDRRRGLQRRGRHRAARRGRGAAARQRAQGGRRHERARHGLRQARPRLRRALPGARLGDLLLPAGRARRAAASSTPTSCCCAAPRTAGSRTSSSSRRSRGASWSTACSRRSTRAGEDGLSLPALSERGEPRPRPDRGDAQGARRRGRGDARRQPLGARARARSGTTTASATRR